MNRKGGNRKLYVSTLIDLKLNRTLRACVRISIGKRMCLIFCLLKKNPYLFRCQFKFNIVQGHFKQHMPKCLRIKLARINELGFCGCLNAFAHSVYTEENHLI